MMSMKKFLIAIAMVLFFSALVKADVFILKQEPNPTDILLAIALVIAFILIIGFALYFILKKAKQKEKAKAVK